MNLNDLLRLHDIDPRAVLVLRHRPHEAELNRVLPWLAADKPPMFNAYQQTQGPQLERVMQALVGSGLVASFIGHEPGRALFVGLYAILSSRPLTYTEYWNVPEYREMKAFGMKGWVDEQDGREQILWFDLEQTDFYTSWSGKLVIAWPGGERSWWRRAHRNEIPVHAIREESAFSAAMPEWNELLFSWNELRVLPASWKAALSQWRGVYYIFDSATRKGYVGSAYGQSNLLSRWTDYAASGHGGNQLLRRRDPVAFRFSILQRVSPDMEPSEVIRLENSWKQRLHSREPNGLNVN